MIFTAKIEPGGTAQSFISMLRDPASPAGFHNLQGKCRYLSLQIDKSVGDPQTGAYIGYDSRVGTAGQFAGRAIDATAPTFTLEDFGGGKVPLDFWIIARTGAFASPTILVTIIQDQD